MRKIICFILFGMNFLMGYSQTEWKIYSGIDLTSINKNQGNVEYGSYRIDNNSYRSSSNLGFLGVDFCTGGERLRFEIGGSASIYTDTLLVQRIWKQYNGQYIRDSILVFEHSKEIVPVLKMSINCSIGAHSTLKLLAYNYSKTSVNAGIAIERRFGGKVDVSACLYSPVKNLDKGYYIFGNKIGGGVQVSYVFARKEKLKKEKLKKEKSNSSPTVL
jgi:hypothetical protein